MKIRHLLLGLMICVAGTGAIGLSGGYLDDQNTTRLTPFLIFGQVWYEGGAPCNNPNVSITNLNAGVAWYADTVSDSNFYQTLLTLADVSAGDVLRWSATDGAVFNATNRTVDQGDLERGGIFDFDVILQSIAPGITGYAPESQIHNIENATRRFNITIDQVVAVAWQINGSPIHTNESVTDAACTYTVGIGVWNISARASNENGTAMQEWLWDVVSATAPWPASPFMVCGRVNYEGGGACEEHAVNITNLNTGTRWQAETRSGYSYYELISDSADVGTGDVLEFNVTDGVRYNTTNHTVGLSDLESGGIFGFNLTLVSTALQIIGYAPESPVYDAENVKRRFNITIDQVVNVTWLINGAEVQTDDSVTDASYTTSAVLGVRNVSAIVTNQNGTDTQEWIWHVTPYVPPPSPIFVIYGNVFYVDNTLVDAPYVVVTNRDTGRRFVADNLSGSNFYQIITNASELRANDTLLIDASKDGVPVENGSVEHTVMLNEGRSGAVRADINRGLVDLQVVAISTPTYIFDGRNNTITATIANNGTTDSGRFNVSLAVDGVVVDRADIESLDIGCVANVTFNWRPPLTVTGNHTLTVTADSDGEIDESDETNNSKSMDDVFVGVPDFTVLGVIPDPEYCVIGDTVRINATVANLGAMDEMAVVQFYDTGRLDITRSWKEWEGYYGIWYNDTIALPGALAIRLHFSNIGSGSTIHIYDKNGSKVDVKSDVTWTDWIPGDTLRIEEQFATFTIDRYQALIENRTINLTAGGEKIVTASYRNATMGDHDISVAIDPHNTVPEYDETNNSDAAQVSVDGFDLEVGGITTIPYDWYVDDIVTVNATIANIGVDDANDCNVIFTYDHNTSKVEFYNATITLSAENSTYVLAPWNLTGIAYEYQNLEYNLNVSVSSDRTPRERHWPRIDTDETNDEYGVFNFVYSNWDFAVENVSVHPQNVVEGGGVDITATINNYGRASENVSVGFYIDMWDNILGGDVVSFAYYDCLGAARGWSRDNVSNANATDRFIRIGTIDDVHVAVGEGTEITLPWAANTAIGNHTIMVVADPDEMLPEINDTYIDESLFGNNMQNCSLGITPPDISIMSINLPVDAYVGEMVDITAGIRNNEDVPAKSTLWWVVERNEPIRADFTHPTTWDSWSATYPGGVMMRAHFKHLDVAEFHNTYVKVIVDHEQVYYKKYPYSKDNFWTSWGSGSTLKVIASAGGGNRRGHVNFTIDKYQVVIGNETITLDAGESYGTIWNATVLPGNYTVWADVDDQNMSAAMFVGGTDLAVTDLSVPDEVWDGDIVSIDVIITNLGQVDAGGFTVEIYDQCYEEPVAVESFSGLKAGGSMSISVPWTASLNSDDSSSHDHTIKVVVTPDDGLREINLKNNEDEAVVHVEESRDFSVANLTFVVDNSNRNPSELVLGENVTMTAAVDVTNLANRGGTLDVGFYRDNKLLNTTSVIFDAGNGTKYAVCAWFIDVSRGHEISVIVDLDDCIVEIDESNNRGDQEVYIRAPDLAVTNISLDKDNIEVGIDANITVVFANTGDWAASTNITIDDYGRKSVKDHYWYQPLKPGGGWSTPVVPFHMDGASAMKLYLDIDMDGDSGWVRIEDSQHREILYCDKNFHNWTPWVLGDCIYVVRHARYPDSVDTTVHKIQYLEQSDTIAYINYSLDAGDPRNVTVNWNASTGGAHCIVATVDPEDLVMEHDESNNMFIKFISVRGAEPTISDVWFMVNGTAVDEIKDGDAVNITVNITNIGIKAADNFTVSFYVDNVEIGSSHVSSLLPNESINISMDWNASLGSHWISIEAVESWIEKEIYVCAAELSGNISWDPPKPLDEDIVTINATITNSGCIPAEEFMVLMFYDYTPERFCSSIDMIGQSPMWINKNVYYGGAEWIYVYIAWHTDLDAGDLVITDKNGTEVRPDKSGFVLVRGDTVNVDARTRGDNAFEIQFYPDCAGNTSKVEGLDAGQRTNISLVKQVTSFNHTITLIIDPEDNVLENNETDNTISATMYVTPTRDFVVMNVTAETNLSDTDTTMITATVANIGIRNGTTNVSFIDYERERRTYPYWFGEHIAGDADGRYRPPYAPVDPPDMSTVIHRPGADAIEIDLTYGAYCNDPPLGEVWVCDGTGKTVWHVMAGVGVNRVGTTIVFVEGDTATIHRYGASYYYPSEYTTIHELNRTEVTLNATDTWNESRTLTSIWNASTGDHTITIIADPDDEIGEIDELNNNKSIPIHVGASRDPAIINLTNTPLNPSDGDDVAITAEVRNNGNKTANFTVDFWENTSKRYETDSSHISVPGASFVNIHLKYIREQLFIPVHECVPIDDIWLDGSIGDTLETGTDGAYQTVCGMIACPGHDWYDHVDRIQYMKLLNRTPVSLAPNETINVTAIWEKMSIKDDPDYSVIVIVDPEDEIDEINESNNEMECEIVMKYPDFEIGRFESPTKMRDARVTIRNTGIGDADDVNVTFELSRREECEGCASASPGYHPIPPGGHDGASDVRVHFDRIRMKDNGKIRILDKRGTSYATYRENADDFWSPWVEHDRVRVGCSRAYFKIDMYEWGDVEEDEIDHLGGGCSDAREIKMEEWEWEYTEPMNLTVRVDPDDEFLEMDEENNEETVIVYKDLAADGIRFDDPIDSKLSLSVAEFKVNVMIGNVETLGDDGMALPISNFNVTLEFRYRDNQTPIFNVTEHVNEALEVGDFIDVPFTFESDRFNGTYGNLTVRAVADSSNDICESNDLYPLEENEDRWGEWNNNHTRDVYIHERSGYAGGGDLVNIAQGEVNGRVVYTIGDSSRLGSGSISADGSVSTLTVTFDDTIPDGAEVEFARLYLYVDSGSEPGNRGIARPIEADMEFNRHKIQTDREYTDISVASHWNVTYGLYCYDVTDIDIEKENVAVATRISPYDGNYWFGIAAIGLLVVYVDEDEPLTKYWINEGTDVMMPDITTGLSFEDCIVTAEFDGVEREGPDGVNATLMTILSLVGGRTLQEGANGEGDALKFNGYKIGTLINHEDRSHWGYQQSAIAMTDNKWESVTDDLKRGNNLAEIQSKGNFIVPANAFLRLIFPPDLNVINLTAPASTVVGAHHSINTTIRNDGRSDAHDFNVTFHIDGNQMIRIPHLDLAAGENMTIHLYNWTPMLLMHVYNLTAAADVLSGEDWTEIEIDNNAMTKRVPIEEGGFGNQTGPRGIGGGSNPTGGEYTEPITGRVMRGIKEFLSGGGGGGAGMFSLTEWIMKGAVWLVLLFFVCAGYRMEQRSYGRVGVGLGSRI